MNPSLASARDGRCDGGNLAWPGEAFGAWSELLLADHSRPRERRRQCGQQVGEAGILVAGRRRWRRRQHTDGEVGAAVAVEVRQASQRIVTGPHEVQREAVAAVESRQFDRLGVVFVAAQAVVVLDGGGGDASDFEVAGGMVIAECRAVGEADSVLFRRMAAAFSYAQAASFLRRWLRCKRYAPAVTS